MLDSCFSVEVDDQFWFTNIRLAEFHVIEFEGDIFLWHVGKLTPYRASERLARLFTRIASPIGSGEWVSAPDFEALQRLNLIANMATEPLSGSDQKTFPAASPVQAVGSISLLVAQTCNMRCTYCYGEDGEYGQKGLMSRQVALDTVDWLIRNSGDFPSVHIGFFGGEPLLNFELVREVVQYGKSQASLGGKEITFGLITNGVRLSETHMRFLHDHDVAVTVSFDGPRDIQDAQRPLVNGAGSYDRVVRNVRALKRYFPDVSARATVCGNSDLETVSQGIAEAGFSNFQLMRVSNSSDSDGEHGARVDRMLALERLFAKDLVEAIKARNLDEKPARGMVSYYLGWLLSPVRYNYYCGAGRGVFSISASGDVYPCHRFVGNSDFKLGSIGDFETGKQNLFHDRQVDSLPECSSCWVRHACGGGCYHNNYVRRGHTHLRDHNSCRETRSVIEMAIGLSFQLDENDRKYYSSKRASAALSHLTLDPKLSHPAGLDGVR